MAILKHCIYYTEKGMQICPWYEQEALNSTANTYTVLS